MADIVVIVHFLWVLFLLFGWVWGRKSRVVRFVHLSGLCVALMIEMGDLICPVTHVEVWLRSRSATGGVYTGSFLAHYLESVLYIEIPRWIVAALTVILCGFNLYVYRRKS